MGSLGDNNGEIKHRELNTSSDFSDAETQPFDFDCQFSPPPFSGGKDDNVECDELHYLQSTVPFDDNNVPVEGGSDTQVVDFGGETQVLNFGGETQVLNFGGETQVLNHFDCLDNMETQLLDEIDHEVALDSDGEGTDRTEVLDDGDEVSIDEVVRGDCDQLDQDEEEKTNETLEQCEASTDENRSSGIHVSTATPDDIAVPESKSGSVRRFTSVRAASLRASGLAARNTALQRMNSISCSIRTDSQFSDQCTFDSNGSNPKVVGKINQADDQGNYDDNSIGLRYGINCRIGCSTARKLFAEDCSTESQGLSCSNETSDAREEDLLKSPDHDGPSAGLSYVDSQEPGELSQANALNFVERLVNDNLMELDDELDLGKSTGGKSKLTSCAKGSLSLAKKTIEKSTGGEARIFDWNDLLEDEGGGDIYCRRKEEFYGDGKHSRKSRTVPPKPRGRKLDESCNEDQPNVNEKILVHSDSKLLLGNSKDNEKTVREGQMNFGKNLFNKFDKQFNSDSSRGQLEAIAAKTLAPEVPTVGFDTQVAAEAMEALFYGDGATDENATQGIETTIKGSSKGSLRGKSRKRVSSREPALGKDIFGADAAPVTRSKRTKRSKDCSVLQEKHSKNIRKECDTRLLPPKMKKANSNADEHQIVSGIDTYKTPSKSIKQRKTGGASERSHLHGNGRLNRDSSINEGHPEKVHTVSPVAHRTRHSVVKQRSSLKMYVDVESDDVDAHSKISVQPEDNAKSVAVFKRSRRNSRSTSIHSTTRRIAQSSVNTCLVRNLADQNSEGKLSHQSSDKQGAGDDALNCTSTEMKGTKISASIIGPEAGKAAKHSDGNCDAVSSPMTKALSKDVPSGTSPKEKSKPPGSVYTTPVNRPTPINAVSPVCMGEEYFKQSCKKNLSKFSLVKELKSLSSTEPEPISPLKDLRKRRDLASVRVLFSNHLDEDLIKQQKKILARLCISEASSILDATHFITDKFVRTRNMLEAIASGKPVVTHLWLESIGQVNIHIDDEAYVLRDIKKEKELGFCMPVSLARARKRPLLKGRRVLITPNTKPGKETISRLVTAVHGQAVERIGKFDMTDDKVPDDLLVLSCEEDCKICVPFLEKGAAVYSSELLLNGIVTQKLDYERHRLFADHVRRTRSTIWLKKDNKFLPVKKGT